MLRQRFEERCEFGAVNYFHALILAFFSVEHGSPTLHLRVLNPVQIGSGFTFQSPNPKQIPLVVVVGNVVQLPFKTGQPLLELRGIRRLMEASAQIGTHVGHLNAAY